MDPLRPEEIIVEAYRQRRARTAAGEASSRVVMSRAHYDLIQNYHAMLGDVTDGAVDYIGRYRLFDLDICIEQVDEIRVE